MAKNYPDIDCPTNIVDTYNVNSGINNTCQTQLPVIIAIWNVFGCNLQWAHQLCNLWPITNIPHCFSHLCWCITYYRWYASYTVNGGSPPMTQSPSRPLATTTTALWDTEPICAACSPCTLAISQSTVKKHPTHTTTHGMSVSRASPVGFSS